MKKILPSLVLCAFTMTTFAADKEQKESCLAQTSLSKLIIKYRLAGESKQEQLATNKKLAANETIDRLTTAIINVVYAAKINELDLVPGMIYASCINY